jgi:hypothetical protein
LKTFSLGFVFKFEKIEKILLLENGKRTAEMGPEALGDILAACVKKSSLVV